MTSKAVSPKPESSWREQREGGVVGRRNPHHTALTHQLLRVWPARATTCNIIHRKRNDFLGLPIQNLMYQQTAQPWKEYDLGDQIRALLITNSFILSSINQGQLNQPNIFMGESNVNIMQHIMATNTCQSLYFSFTAPFEVIKYQQMLINAKDKLQSTTSGSHFLFCDTKNEYVGIFIKEGWAGCLQLVDANYHTQNGWTTSAYCVAQETIFNILG